MIGSQLGFPTANIETAESLILPQGVFSARIQAKGHDFHGVANIGCRPTVHEDSPLTVEVHLLDTEGDFYGEPFRVFLVEKLRNEAQFDSKDALIKQIRLDIEAARNSLGTGLAASS